jgi:Trypsin-like peptidase domain
MMGPDEPVDLHDVIAAGNSAAIDQAVATMLRNVAVTHDASGALEAVEALMAARRFDAMLRLADGAARLAPADQAWQLWPHVVQALIELGATNTAQRVITQLLTHTEPEATASRGALAARLGRMQKDDWVDTGDSATLVGAIRSYLDASQHGADPLWAGVNVVALRAAAARRGIDDGVTDAPAVDQLLALAATAPLPRSAWSLATELELRLARGEKDTLPTLLSQLFDAPEASPFVYGSMSRQLLEIWELDPSDPLLVMLGERTLASGTGEVVLPTTAEGYEKTFGTEYPIAIDVYLRGVERARSVGILLRGGSFPVGTVFALDGAVLHPSLADRIVLVTNEHVIPDPAVENGTQAAEVEAHFDAPVPGENSASLAFKGLRAIWHSPRKELDVTLLLSDDPAAQQLTGLPVADMLPPVRDGAYVYIVGHPLGGKLQLSIRGNDLLDHDGTTLHYLAPTKEGSSGSPVFDENWGVIGVHHKGSDQLPALHGATRTYPGNEGHSIAAIRDALATRPPTL